MTPLAEVVAGLRRNQLAFKFALEREVRLELEKAAKHARSFIGDEGTPGWAPLAASTIEDKIAQGFPVPAPLARTGALQDSIEAEVESTSTGVEGIVGSTSPIAIFQELGDARLPPRPFLGPSLMLAEPEIARALGELAVRALRPGAVL